jgi:hypothetical protein
MHVMTVMFCWLDFGGCWVKVLPDLMPLPTTLMPLGIIFLLEGVRIAPPRTVLDGSTWIPDVWLIVLPSA